MNLEGLFAMLVASFCFWKMTFHSANCLTSFSRHVLQSGNQPNEIHWQLLYWNREKEEWVCVFMSGFNGLWRFELLLVNRLFFSPVDWICNKHSMWLFSNDLFVYLNCVSLYQVHEIESKQSVAQWKNAASHWSEVQVLQTPDAVVRCLCR